MPTLPPDVERWLPTFVIIGAPKAGTTSLHEYLAVHPQIAMSDPKEPMCFVWPDQQHQMERFRDELFDRHADVRGESSTAYASYPYTPESLDRMAAVIPQARIIYIVRDPIPRALSHYAQAVWDRFPIRPFDELMADLEDRMNIPIWASRYATQLERFLRVYPRERVLVLEQRELLRERQRVLRRVFEFLEVDPDFSSPLWVETHNTQQQHRLPTARARSLGALGKVALKVPVLERALTAPVPTPVPTDEQYHRIRAVLLPEAERLRAMTDLDLSHWTIWRDERA